MVVFVDYQCFSFGKRLFFIKELAILNDQIPIIYDFLFEPPQNTKQVAQIHQKHFDWLSRQLLGFKCTEGDTPHENLSDILTKITTSEERIYVKGLQKKKILGKLLPTKLIINIEDLHCPSLRELQRRYENEACGKHLYDDASCSLRNVRNLVAWYNEHGANTKMLDEHDEVEKLPFCCFCL